MNLKCLFGHRLTRFRNIRTTYATSTLRGLSAWLPQVSYLNELYSDSCPTTFFMDASCTRCGAHIEVNKKIPIEIANFINEKHNKELDAQRERIEKERPLKKKKK